MEDEGQQYPAHRSLTPISVRIVALGQIISQAILGEAINLNLALGQGAGSLWRRYLPL